MIPQPTILIKLKKSCPAAVLNGKNARVIESWSNIPLEPYGTLIPAYGDKYPYNQPHISVAMPGFAAFSVVALDEIDGELPQNLPKNPSYRGESRTFYRKRR